MKAYNQYLILVYLFKRQESWQKNTSVTLDKHLEDIIEKSISSRRFASASEVIHAELRLIDEREQKIKLLREAIEAGENSGYVKKFDPVKHLVKLNTIASK